MHAQTESAPEHRAHFASRLHIANGLGLYLLTLAGEAMLGAGARWLLTYLGASARRLPWDTAQHPPTAHRIERLLANYEGTGSK